MREFFGKVQKGAGRGRELGFPTVNLSAPRDVQDGIYVARVLVREWELPALLFVGVAETFGESERRAEVFILHFEEELYGETLNVRICRKIRESKKFMSAEELMWAMQGDLRVAREYFKVSSCLPE